jgi:hypothetical protein
MEMYFFVMKGRVSVNFLFEGRNEMFTNETFTEIEKSITKAIYS